MLFERNVVEPWTFKHRVSLILANMTLFDFKLIQQKLVFFLNHKIVFIVVRMIL